MAGRAFHCIARPGSDRTAGASTTTEHNPRLSATVSSTALSTTANGAAALLQQHGEPPANAVLLFAARLMEHGEPPANAVLLFPARLMEHGEPPANAVLLFAARLRGTASLR